MAATILIVDDEADIRVSLQGILEDEGYETLLAEDGEDALETIRGELPDLVLLDVWMPGMDGMETLAHLKEEFPFITVVMISGHGTIETAIKATRLGAYDFIEKPLSLDKVLITVSNALKLKQLSIENSQLKQNICRQYDMVGETESISLLRQNALLLAASTSSFLITGEKGSGKCLLAGFIHYNSPRRDKPFGVFRCGAVPEELVEQELFGYEKNAFSGAISGKKGLLDRLDGGGILLDEIGELPRSSQAKILKLIREGYFERIGGNKPVHSTARIIATTSINLPEKCKNGNFIEELYQEIGKVILTTPPLRERLSDIPILLQYLICQFSRHEGREVKNIEPAVIEALQSYSWPGNIRELRNVVERILIMSTGSTITMDALPEFCSETNFVQLNQTYGSNSTLKTAREEFERQFILQKLEENEWNVSRTAELIGVERTSLHRKIKSYGIDAYK